MTRTTANKMLTTTCQILLTTSKMMLTKMPTSKTTLTRMLKTVTTKMLTKTYQNKNKSCRICFSLDKKQRLKKLARMSFSLPQLVLLLRQNNELG